MADFDSMVAERKARTYAQIMIQMAESAMRDAMKIAEAAKKLDEGNELIVDAHSRVHDLAVTVCALVNLATKKEDHQLHSDLTYYVAQINKTSWNMPDITTEGL